MVGGSKAAGSLNRTVVFTEPGQRAGGDQREHGPPDQGAGLRCVLHRASGGQGVAKGIIRIRDNGVVLKMITRFWQTISEASVTEDDLSIPGLTPNRFGTCSIQIDTSLQSSGSSLTSVMRLITKSWMDDRMDLSGWICCDTLFSSSLQAFADSGWSTPSVPYDVRSRTSGSYVLWQRLPDTNSEEWIRVWEAPLDPIATNIVIVSSLKSGALIPPDISCSPSESEFSTLIKWPWVSSREMQSEWLHSVQDSILLIGLGLLDCASGIQIVVPADETRRLRNVVSRYTTVSSE